MYRGVNKIDTVKTEKRKKNRASTGIDTTI